MRVAVASKDGISINLHFGHAKRFYIYEVSGSWMGFVETRDVDHYCHGNVGDESAMTKILATISDCQYCFVAKIGDGPIKKLADVGVQAVDEYAYEGISEAFQLYFAKEAIHAE